MASELNSLHSPPHTPLSPPHTPRSLPHTPREEDHKSNLIAEKFFPCPATPAGKNKKRKILRLEKPFFNEIPSLGKTYMTPKGREHRLVKQIGVKNCGGAAAIMFAHSNLKPDLDPEFVLSCNKAEMISREELAKKINDFFAAAAKDELFDDRLSNSIEINKDAFLQYLQNKLSTSEGSVIVGITHKTLEGHYIVVDEYDGEYYYIRDPYSGSAFKLTTAEFQDNLENDCGINIVYFTK